MKKKMRISLVDGDVRNWGQRRKRERVGERFGKCDGGGKREGMGCW